jgi:hypothetical protein
VCSLASGEPKSGGSAVQRGREQRNAKHAGEAADCKTHDALLDRPGNTSGAVLGDKGHGAEVVQPTVRDGISKQ